MAHHRFHTKNNDTILIFKIRLEIKPVGIADLIKLG